MKESQLLTWRPLSRRFDARACNKFGPIPDSDFNIAGGSETRSLAVRISIMAAGLVLQICPICHHRPACVAPLGGSFDVKTTGATAAKSRHRVETATASLLNGRDTQPAITVVAWCKEKVRAHERGPPTEAASSWGGERLF
jgi:hypothetical protein